MNITQFKEHITSLFEEHLNKYGDDEYGFTHLSKEEFHKIGYTTNLTLETIEEAYRNGVDMMVTHHAPWSFLFGMEEKVKSWKNHDRPVKRIAILTGAGNNTNLIERALEKGCDTYITGEKTLYTVQHAKFKGINLIVGSHTFTEVFGVESLARKLKERDRAIEITRLNEEHLE